MQPDQHRQPMALWKRYRRHDAAFAFRAIEILVLVFVMATVFAAGIDTFDTFRRKSRTLTTFGLLPELRLQIMLHYDLYGEWPDDKETLEAIRLEKRVGSGFIPWQPQSFSNLLGDYQLRGAFVKEEIDFEPPESAAGKDDTASLDLLEPDVDYMVVDGSVTFNLKDGIEPGQPISLLSFRPTSSKTAYPPSFYWSCGQAAITEKQIAQGPNHTNLKKESLFSICR